MLATGCIYAPRRPGWHAIAIPSRLTLDDGVTPIGIDPPTWDEHWPVLGPPGRLIGPYLRHEIGWEEFAAGYLSHLLDVQDAVRRLIELARVRNVIVLCVEGEETDPARLFCHRRLLAEFIQHLAPDLEVQIR